MVKLLSPIHHGLRLPLLGIKFKDGEADVAEDLVTGALAFAYLGVTVAEDSVADESDESDESEESEDEAESESEDADGDESDEDLDDLEDVEDVADESEEADASEAVADAAAEQPRGNASRDAWVAYAESLGVPVAAGATRDEIRALFE